MNQTAFRNQVEILFYSFLINSMSEAGKLRSALDRSMKSTFSTQQMDAWDTGRSTSSPIIRRTANAWAFFNQTLIPLLIWVIMGFSAGFMVGMLNPR